tara:strand:+ start:288 stop:410 length:123 start_codon:yes stop_codon:yes gene_type:complete
VAIAIPELIIDAVKSIPIPTGANAAADVMAVNRKPPALAN